MKYVLFFLLGCSIGCTTDTAFESAVSLPKVLNEVSGMVYSAKESAFWMHNDSGNSPSLYLVSTKGKLLRTRSIQAPNTDWEDLATDSLGNLYIGDFGNNANKRKDLRIYRVPHNELRGSADIDVTSIHFYYPEQEQYPPKMSKRYFDAEAMIVFRNKLYIFTKSRVDNDSGTTFLYRIPNEASSPDQPHKATRISSFTSCSEQACRITGATISSKGDKVALLTSNSVWVFKEFQGDDFFSGSATQYPFEHTSQKEAITFSSSDTLYIADEKGMSFRNYVYAFVLDNH